MSSDAISSKHARAAGELCVEDATGCCRDCGVSINGMRCRECKARGYHRDGCALIETFDPTEEIPTGD